MIMEEYNKIIERDKMTIDEAVEIISNMYEYKFKETDDAKFTNLEFAAVRLLKEIDFVNYENENLRHLVKRLAERQYELGFHELAEYMLAEIDEIPMWRPQEKKLKNFSKTLDIHHNL